MSLTSFCCLYSKLWTYFSPFSVSIVDFLQVNVFFDFDNKSLNAFVIFHNFQCLTSKSIGMATSEDVAGTALEKYFRQETVFTYYLEDTLRVALPIS